MIEGEFKDGRPVSTPVQTQQLSPPPVKSKEKFEQWKRDNQQKIELRKKLHHKRRTIIMGKQ